MGFFGNKPKYHFEIGGGAFVADFYVDEKRQDVGHNYLRIWTPNKVFEQKVVGHPYGYLLAAVEQGNEEEVHNYCVMLWRVTQEIYQDGGLANDIIRAFVKRDRRLMKQARRGAASVSEAQEAGDQALMEDIAGEAGMSAKELKAKRAEDRQVMKEILDEGKE